jgi:hypothetical protein
VVTSIALFLWPIGLLDCGSGMTSPCPLTVPKDKSPCNSGGVSVYCHYDCVAGGGTAYYALCSGPAWNVSAFPVDCSSDAGPE